jgi:hypothetical protein
MTSSTIANARALATRHGWPAENRGTISERSNRVTGAIALTTTSRTGGGPAMATTDPTPERMATIYVLCDGREMDPIKRVRYVGQTVRSLEIRLRHHWQTANAGEQWHRARWMRAVKSAGGDVLMEPVARVSVSEADSAEIAHISSFRARGCDLTNRNNGGRGGSTDVSPETRQKMSESARQRGPRTPETQQKITEALRKLCGTPEMREQMRLRSLGRKRSTVTRARISASNSGEKNHGAKLTYVLADAIRNRHAAGETQADLVREFGLSFTTIHGVVHGTKWATEKVVTSHMRVGEFWYATVDGVRCGRGFRDEQRVGA